MIRYRSCYKLAIEGSLHDLAKELFPKHLLSELHQLKDFSGELQILAFE